MGDEQPRDGAGREPVMAVGGRPRAVTVQELRDWRDHGAVWRTVELGDDHAVIDLCTCSGEPMERVYGEDPALIAYVRTHRDDW